MKLLVIGSGRMGCAAACDMARTPPVSSVTLADSDAERARNVVARVNRIAGDKKVRADCSRRGRCESRREAYAWP